MKLRLALLIAVAAAAIAAAVWALFFRASDEQRIKDALARTAAAVEVTSDDASPILRVSRIRGVFKDTVDKSAHLSAEELHESATGRDDLANAAAALSNVFTTCAIDLSDVDVQLQAGGASARVKANATLAGNDRGGTKRRERRALTFLMMKNDGQWQIASITVWPSDDRQ